MAPRIPIVAVLLVASLSWARPSHACDQSPASCVQPGMTVLITDEAGKLVEGRVTGISGDAIQVKHRKTVEDVPLPSIIRIEKPDSVRNGALTGAAIGGGLGLVGFLASDSRDPVLFLWGTVGGAAFYGAIGTAIDAFVNNRRTLYERGARRETHITPVIGPKVAGAAIRMTW